MIIKETVQAKVSVRRQSFPFLVPAMALFSAGAVAVIAVIDTAQDAAMPTGQSERQNYIL